MNGNVSSNGVWNKEARTAKLQVSSPSSPQPKNPKINHSKINQSPFRPFVFALYVISYAISAAAELAEKQSKSQGAR